MINQFVITKRLSGTEENVQYFQWNTSVFFFVRQRAAIVMAQKEKIRIDLTLNHEP